VLEEDVLAHREPQPMPALLGGEERLEQLAELRFGDAGAMVGDADRDLAPW
jgi:hypothetical protein